MRILILGATGYLGSPLYATFSESLEFQVFGTSRKLTSGLIQLDITDKNAPEQVVGCLKKPEDTVLFLSAISKPELCQSNFVFANQVNVKSTRELISRILENGNRVLFFSSDTVYGERRYPAVDGSPLSPVGLYAFTKSTIEEEFLPHSNFKSIRISYVYSPHDSLTKYLRNSVENGIVAEIYHPFSRDMIYINDLIEGVVSLTRNWTKFSANSINFGGPETISKIQYTEVLRDTLLPRLEYKVVAPPPGFFFQRPQVIKMHSATLTQLLGRIPRKVRQAFLSEEYVQEWSVS